MITKIKLFHVACTYSTGLLANVGVCFVALKVDHAPFWGGNTRDKKIEIKRNSVQDAGVVCFIVIHNCD